MRIHRWLIPVAALVAITPLAGWGPSCGKDMPFHLQSWLDVAAQMRHGALLPRWNFLSAYNAGEPRYIFYPPVSWWLGGALSLALPFQWVATVLSWIAMCIAGFSMWRLVSSWASRFAAMLAACIYMANPFMVFSIAARSAYGEIFAAALLPLLASALLREELSAVGLALPLAGICLSNVPGGVIAAYLYGGVAVVRIAWSTRPTAGRWRMLRTYAVGAVLAVMLAAFYLLPAWHQRSLIHAAEPFQFPLRPVDSLFFARVLQPAVDEFLIRIEHLALAMAAATFLMLSVAWLRLRTTGTVRGSRKAIVIWSTALLAIVVCIMLTAPTALLWRTLPGLYILQFPWRLLLLLAPCVAIATALLVRNTQMSPWTAAAVSLGVVTALSVGGSRLYIQPCDPSETPSGTRARLIMQHHAPEPIDEYVVAGANPGMMRPDNPPFWLASDPLAYASGTTPNIAGTTPGAAMSAVPEQAQLQETPLAFDVDATSAGFVVVNLQSYPSWFVTRNGAAVHERPARPDGLLVVPVDAGASRIAIHWHHSWDEWAGGACSVITLLWVCGMRIRRYAGASS